jgi:hypothetical protein
MSQFFPPLCIHTLYHVIFQFLFHALTLSSAMWFGLSSSDDAGFQAEAPGPVWFLLLSFTCANAVDDVWVSLIMDEKICGAELSLSHFLRWGQSRSVNHQICKWARPRSGQKLLADPQRLSNKHFLLHAPEVLWVFIMHDVALWRQGVTGIEE